MRVGAIITSASVRRAVERRIQVRLRALDDLAHQRVAVGVRAGEARPSTTSPGAIDLPSMTARLLDDADGEAGQIVFAIRVHARHLGGFAADQRAAGQFAACGDALDRRVAAVSTSSLPQAK